MSRLVASNLPNLITVGRLFLVPAIIASIADGRWTTAFIVFVLAGISDAVDGFLAKRFEWQSRLGAYLDPVADKALLMSIYVALAVVDVVPPWLSIMVVSRDVMIVGAVLIAWLLGEPIEIRPLLVSKLNTTAQIAFAALVLGGLAFGADLAAWFNVALATVAALTLASAAAYLGQWLDHMTEAA